MTNVVPFRRPAPEKGKGNTLCREGHHKWKIVQEKQFDSRSGKLVTLYQCTRCQQQKTQLL
jgi:hypothetical protein